MIGGFVVIVMYFLNTLSYHKNMALVTTTIGSHPLPKGLNIANWFQAKDMDPEKATKKHTVFLENKNNIRSYCDSEKQNRDS
jgi:hypothetical protein